jgi:sugar lactone lactonase YvrE
MKSCSRVGLWCALVLLFAASAAAQTLTYEPLVSGTTASRLTAGPDGALYAGSNYTIRRITASGSSSVYAGVSGTSGYLDGHRSTALLTNVGGIAFDAEGRLVFSDFNNHVIRRIENDGTVVTIAGTPQTSGFVNGPALSARFYYPQGVAVAGDGSIYIVDSYNHAVRKLATDGTVSTFAGGAVALPMAPARARGSPIEAIVKDANGDFYVADTNNMRIRR